MDKIFRKLSVIIGIIVLAGGVYMAKTIATGPQKEKEEAAKTPSAQTKEEVPFVLTTNVKNEEIKTAVNFNGKVIYRDKVEVFSDVKGLLINTPKALRNGVYFQKGELMFSIDDTELKLDIKAAKSQLKSSIVRLLPNLENDFTENVQAWKSYVNNFNIEQPILTLPSTQSERESYYIAAQALESQYLNIKKSEYLLTKYRIYAPISGVIIQSNIHKGALVRNGQQLCTLMNNNQMELEATVPLGEISHFKKGRKATLYSEASGNQWPATIQRFGVQIDEQTQSQKIYLSVSGKGLNEGMLLNGNLPGTAFQAASRIPRKLLIDDKAVYIIQNEKLKLQPVQVLKFSNNDALVKGINEKHVLLNQSISGAFEGMKVQSKKS